MRGLVESDGIANHAVKSDSRGSRISGDEDDPVARVQVTSKRTVDPVRPRGEIEDPATHDVLVRLIERSRGPRSRADSQGVRVVAIRDVNKSPVEVVGSRSSRGSSNGDGQVLDLAHPLNSSRRDDESGLLVRSSHILSESTLFDRVLNLRVPTIRTTIILRHQSLKKRAKKKKLEKK